MTELDGPEANAVSTIAATALDASDALAGRDLRRKDYVGAIALLSKATLRLTEWMQQDKTEGSEA